MYLRLLWSLKFALSIAFSGVRFNQPLHSDYWNDWVFVASYVNNFVYTAPLLECDAYAGAAFDYARGTSKPFGKDARVIKVKKLKKPYDFPLPFYVVAESARACNYFSSKQVQKTC